VTGLPRIELVYDSDCPNADRARDAIRTALRAVGAPEIWKEWNRGVPDTPQALRGFGSPTVLVDGRDVGGDGGRSTDADSSSCRIYVDEAGRISGLPSFQLILAALGENAKNRTA
jgi:hypothetical protein